MSEQPPQMHPYSTHLPLLAACVARTSGPVLELGSGLYSTALLHGLCIPLGRELVTVDNDEAWLSRFRHYQARTNGRHRVRNIPSGGWPEAPIESPRAWEIYADRWSVVLVDQAPPKARAATVERLHGHADLIVCHDSEHRVYDYEPALARFAHRVEWRRYQPWATVVSNVMRLDWLESLL